MIIITILTSLIVAVVDYVVEGRMTIVVNSYGFVVPVLVLLPHIACTVSDKVATYISKEWLRRFDWYAFFIIAINIPGSIYFHDLGIQYDRFIHFGSVFFGTLLVLIFYLLIQIQIRKRHTLKSYTLLFSLVFVFAGLFLWEAYQYTIDAVFGSKIFYDASQSIVLDVKEDILFGLAGLILAIAYINYSFTSFLSATSQSERL